MLRNRSLSAVVALGVIALLLIATSAVTFAKGPGSGQGDGPDKTFQWKTMVGVPAGLTGVQSQAPLRGINGGGVPWTLQSGRGELKSNGHVEVEVEGLVLLSTGSNPAAAFRVLVSCVNPNGTFTNVLSADTFPATTGLATAGGGDSEIETDLALPSTCIAPIIFVTSTGGSWFAATGF